MFQVSAAGDFTTLHSFDPDGEGTNPSTLIQGADGAFYGTTQQDGPNGSGAIFRITSTGDLNLLYAFTATVYNATDEDPTNPDGSNPSRLLLASDGNFYGTAQHGGTNGTGTVFKVSSTGVLSSLYSFDEDKNGLNVNGANPLDTLVQGLDGNFYGTTSEDGQNGSGTAFELLVVSQVSSATSAAAFLGQPFTYPITASNLPKSYGAGGLPAGLSVNATTGVISGTPTVAGTFAVTFSAINGAGTGAGTLSLVITGPPVISSALTGNARQGDAFTYPIADSNSPTSYAASGLPAGLSVDATTGVISGTPTAVCSFNVSLQAANGAGTGSATLVLTIAPAIPTVTLTATMPTVAVGSAQMGLFTLSLSAAQDHDLIVNLLIKGTASDGTDYVMLKMAKKIKAGKTSKPIQVIPLGDLDGASKKTVVLTLAPGDGYTVGTTGKVKVKILSGQ